MDSIDTAGSNIKPATTNQALGLVNRVKIQFFNFMINLGKLLYSKGKCWYPWVVP